ncbi:MAG: hypothetical protein C0469_16375 [Cyanobacteria bacterium DS2.3.42]|nr:hypothetical protein [Cyanobacteria bacterium DS2.3.42]
MMHLDPYVLQHSSCFLRQGNKTSIFEKILCLFVPLIGFFGLWYFFEDLGIEMEVAARERTQPGIKCFYQQGFMHTQLGNFECNVLHMGEHYPVDAAVLYRKFRHRWIRISQEDVCKPPLFFPTQTFTAEYEVVFSDDPRGPSHERISCNGAGLLIHEWNKLRFLYDCRKHLEFIIDPSEFRVYVHPLRKNVEICLNEEMFLKSGHDSFYFKCLGEEKLDGHQCRVYGYEAYEKRFYDKDTHLLILQKGGGPGRTYTTKLMKCSPHALPSTEFELPKNYSLIDCTR